MHIDFGEAEHYLKTNSSKVVFRCVLAHGLKSSTGQKDAQHLLWKVPLGQQGVCLPRGGMEDALGRHSGPYLSALCQSQEPSRAKPLYLGVLLHQMECSFISSSAPVPYLPPPPPRLSHRS